MPFVAIPNCAKVELLYTYAGHPAVNVLHVEEGAAPDAALMSAIGGAFLTAYVANVLAIKNTAFVINSVRVTDLTTAVGPQAVVTSGAAGSDTAAPGSAALAAIIRLHTALRGKRNRGRVFDAGYSAGAYGGATGVIPPATIAALVGNWQAMRDDLATDGFPLVVASRTGADFNLLTDVSVPAIAGVQRRRIRE